MTWAETFGWLAWWTAFAAILTVGLGLGNLTAESNGVLVWIPSVLFWPPIMFEIALFLASIISFAIANENRL